MKNLLRYTTSLLIVSAVLSATAHAASPDVDPFVGPGLLGIIGGAFAAVFSAPAHAAAAGTAVTAPEIDPSLLPAACTLIGGTMMILRGRRKA